MANQIKTFIRKPKQINVVCAGEWIKEHDDRDSTIDALVAGKIPIFIDPELKIEMKYDVDKDSFEIRNFLHGSWIPIKETDYLRVDDPNDIYPIDKAVMEQDYTEVTNKRTMNHVQWLDSITPPCQ